MKTYRVVAPAWVRTSTPAPGVITPKNLADKGLDAHRQSRSHGAGHGRSPPGRIWFSATRAGTQVARAIRYEAMRPFCRWATPMNVSAEKAGTCGALP